MWKFLRNILLIASIISVAHNEDLGDLRSEFELLKEAFTDLRQSTSQRIADLESKLVEERKRRFLTDGEFNIQSAVALLSREVNDLKQGIGSVYVRWGRTNCGQGNTSTIYRGYIGGKWYADTGGPANYVCLPDHPQWAKYLDGFQDIGNRMYGTEYEDNFESKYNPFSVHRDDEDAPCAVCRSQRATTGMIPARTSCFPGWHLEYTGYLMTMSRHYPSSSEYICVDGDPEVLDRGSTNNNGNLLYVVEAACGALPCGPYVDGRELACAVCSK